MNWGLLVRISREGEGASVPRQEADGRAEVARRGGTVTKVYRENSVSAFKRKIVISPDGTRVLRTIRPDFREALTDLQVGTEIQGLMVYDLDRLTRDPRDLEDTIDVAEQTGRPIASVTGSVDLPTPPGVYHARGMVNHANLSSRDTARRVKRMHQSLAEQGKPSGGRRAYGYTPDRLNIVPAEAEVIRELARRRLAGEGWPSLARDLNRRGIPATGGGQWSLSNTRSAVMKPHAAGLRIVDGRPVRAVWPPILDRVTWEQLQAMTRQPHTPTRRYLLSGIARCGLCGSGMVGSRNKKGGAFYRCRSLDCARITRSVTPIDDYITGVVLVLLADLDLTPPRPPEDPALAGQLRALQERRAAVLAALSSLDGGDPLDLARVKASYDDQIARLTERAAAGRKDRLLGQVRGVTAERWAQLPLDTRRAVLAELVTVTVGPSATTGRAPFDASSIKVTAR